MENPLLEACVIRTTGTHLAFRHRGAIVDPIRRQLIFDFERYDQPSTVGPKLQTLRQFECGVTRVQDLFLEAVEAEECGDKQRAIALYEEILARDSSYAPAAINQGTLYFHMQQYERAEQLYRLATVADPNYVLAYFDLGNVLDEMERVDESIAAYAQAVALAPGYADAHYNLALAYERKNQNRAALRHWQTYLRLDSQGPWAEHARQRIRKLLGREKLTIAWRADHFVPHRQGRAALKLA
jgi:tetratricopeptide (TPR) repeat protein